MKIFATIFLSIVLCGVVLLGFMEHRGRLGSAIPVAIAASNIRGVDELIGKRVVIRFITGVGHTYEEVEGTILNRRGEFLVVRFFIPPIWRTKRVWCNIRHISTIWLEEK